MSLKDLMPKDLPPPADPFHKTKICDAVVSFVLAPMDKKLARQLDKIMEENWVLTNTYTNFLSHMGKVYKHSLTPPDEAPPRMLLRLDPSLHGRMKDWLSDSRDTEWDRAQCINGMAAVLSFTDSLIDLYQILPPSLHPGLHGLMDSPKAVPLSQADLQKAIEKTQDKVAVLRQRMLKNMLL